MEEAPENGKESLNSAHANGMNERTIIWQIVVVYGCETWSLILREECRPRVYENRVLRRI
jgi:hypothetical protein